MNDIETKFPCPKFIVNSYEEQERIRKKVLYGSYSSTDKVVPMLRDRGTLVERGEDGSVRIMGWQKDITRMRKQDVALSFIVYATVDKDGVIQDISLDPSFNGGKGLLCSRTYLEQILKKQLQGQQFEPRIASKFRLSIFKCFHVHEIMNSIYSSYFLFKGNYVGNGKCFHEEDLIDFYADEGNLYGTAVQQYMGSKPTRFVLVFYDMFNHVTFDEEGYMWIKGNVKAEFYLNDELKVEDELYQSEKDHIFMRVQKFVFKCLTELQKELAPDYKKKLMNTNLYSSAIIGLIMQAVGIRAFSDNFNYIQYIMTAMQRPGRKPGCIGSILTEEEAENYFDGFDLNNLV